MLRYLGGGFLRGVPARDLSADEVKQYGRARLLASKLYAPPDVDTAQDIDISGAEREEDRAKPATDSKPRRSKINRK